MLDKRGGTAGTADKTVGVPGHPLERSLTVTANQQRRPTSVRRFGPDRSGKNAQATERDARIGIEYCAEAGWAWGAAVCSAWLGRSLLMQRQVVAATEQLRQALEAGRRIGDPFSTALALSYYAATRGADGDYNTAAASLGEALELFRWGLLAARNGKIDDAAAALAEGLRIANQLGRVPFRIAQLVSGMAQVAAAGGRWIEAAQFLLWTAQIRARSGAQVADERAAEESELRDAILRAIGAPTYTELEREISRLDEAAVVETALNLLTERDSVTV